MDNRIENMSAAARDPVVALMKYNKLRGRFNTGLVFAFEGHDDPIFYSSIAQRCKFQHPFHVLVVDGKDMVLGLRKLLNESSEAEKGDGVAFFIDADFDGLKGHTPSEDIYITPTYSIENFLIDSSTLKSFLYFEFKLYETDLLQDIEKITEIYEELLNRFEIEIREVNRVIFFGRTLSNEICGSQIKSIEESSEKFFKFDKVSLEVKTQCAGELVKTVVKFNNDFDLNHLTSIDSAFNRLSPHLQWRGKFQFSLFKQFLNALVEDRNSSAPKFFTKGKGKVKLNLSTDSAFRLLSGACQIPNCLERFFANLSKAELH